MRSNNPDMRRVFRCSEEELDNLRRAFRAQMQEIHINGRPFLGQLPKDVDGGASMRNELWSEIAASRQIFGAMLSGSRWGADRPHDLEVKLRHAKEKICRDWTADARRPHRRGALTPGRRVSSSPSVTSNSTTSRASRGGIAQAVYPRPGKAAARPYSVRLVPAASNDGPVDDPVPRNEQTDEATQAVSDAPVPIRGIEPDELLHAEHRTLSDRIQQVVNSKVERLQAQIAELEENVVRKDELLQKGAELEAHVTQQVHILLAWRDVEIENLRAKSHAERL